MTYIKGNPRHARISAQNAAQAAKTGQDSVRAASAAGQIPTPEQLYSASKQASAGSNNPRAVKSRRARKQAASSDPRERMAQAYANRELQQTQAPAGYGAVSPVQRNRHEAETFNAVRKQRKRKRVLIGVICALLAVVLVGGGAAFAYIYNIDKNLQSGIDDTLRSILAPTDSAQDPFYMLLLGVDGSVDRVDEFGEDFRSDSIILARIDPQTKHATLISIPRDTKIDNLGDYGTQKINAAHFFGGAALSVETVSELAGVPISHYAEINFDGFKAVVDALGGIEVDVPMEIDDAEAGGHLDAGVQTLNGEQALILCRSRHAYDDYGSGDEYRAANQRVVLAAIAQKILSSDPATLATTLSAFSEYVATDLSVSDIVAIATSMLGMTTDDIYSGSAPVVSEYQNGIWYDILQEDEWSEMMARVDSGEPPTEEDVIDPQTGVIMSTAGQGAVSNSLTNLHAANRSTTISLRNGNGTDGVCSAAEEKLTAAGYSKINSKNADNFDYKETIVVYTEDSAADDAEIIAEILGVKSAMQDETTYLFETDVLVVIGADFTTDE